MMSAWVVGQAGTRRLADHATADPYDEGT